MPEGLERAVAASEVAALGAQSAWTCGQDDVAPVLDVLPLIGRYTRGFLLRHYWLPMSAVALASAAVWALLNGTLG